ncbi:electron transfer flavoprotein-quinone oxidoreductase [Cyclonatronum proteinivorum]|uniref:Electron transfer flavoprotein-quinone oxidoreductase n=1 Tax=Cyclonatronum proteinivorum TaxID=1457365 RepID=A0A345UN13_9BACT|nr:FAD-dependent oxidoreductase [Cyclonatronum proteinivorum]AXJ01865.1 electron transfer flavoprotein-quinone oxidoreductase [Cyclonatronum proteinivorum]
MEDKFDCIVIGGGIAGLSAAMVLARNNMKFMLIERGEFSGAKNVSGGVLWGEGLSKLVPNYWEEEDAGFERFINHRRLTFMDPDSTFSIDFKSESFNGTPYKGVVVLRSKFDNWLAEKVQEAIDQSEHADECFLAPNILVEEVLMQDGKAVGIKAGGDEFYADSVIIAEGVNNLLTRQIGLQDKYVPADALAVGVKEIIRFDQKVLEDRFQLNGLSGMSNEFIGTATQGVEGGGFLYTNRDTLSFGLVLGMISLRDSGLKPYDILNEFKAHPVIRDILRDGEVVEYSAHAVSTGDMKVMPKEIYADGVLVAGEAANLLMNSGKAIQGMDYALHSGVLAAETIVEAKQKGDYSKTTMKSYRDKLEKSFVLQDMRNFQGAVEFLHSKQMFESVPGLVCDFGKQFFSIKNEPTPKTREMLTKSIKKHSSYWDLLKLGLKGARSL